LPPKATRPQIGTGKPNQCRSTFAVQRCRLTVRRRMTATSEVAFVQDAQELNS